MFLTSKRDKQRFVAAGSKRIGRREHQVHGR
jgi:hypothetical protein